MTIRRNFLIGAALSALAVAVAGPAAAASVEGKSICYITAANSHFYVTPTNEGAQAAADAAGVELTIVSEEFSPQTGADPACPFHHKTPPSSINTPPTVNPNERFEGNACRATNYATSANTAGKSIRPSYKALPRCTLATVDGMGVPLSVIDSGVSS